MDKWDWLGIAGIIIVLIAFVVEQVYAESYGIVLDKTCLTYIKNNLTTSCPTYEDLITLFPDTSNQDVSGGFSYHNGIYQREPAKLVNSFEYYRYVNGDIIFIDPPPDTITRIPTIEIKANLDQYLMRGAYQSYNKTEHSLTFGVNRYISNCFHAYVDASNWSLFVGDTLFHMKNFCTPESTHIETTIKTKLNKTVHDITTSYKYKLEQWQKQAIKECGTKICLYEKVQPKVP